ncbi:MAG TPA: S8 family serine peptidase [Arenibacter sp.]|nr:S8 family serine peptidase [Arenibacter sp.]
MIYTRLSNRICNSILLVCFALAPYLSIAQTELQIQRIKDSYPSAKLGAVVNDFRVNFTKENNRLLQQAKANGWEVTERLPNGTYSELTAIGPDGAPLYYSTFSTEVNSAARANTLHDNGLLNLGINGENMTVGVWDAGSAMTDHIEFDSRVSDKDHSGSVDPHATRITGILVASGIDKKSKGVAHRAKAVTHDWTRDKIEVAEMAANGLLLSNHSYGIRTERVPDWYFGSYIPISKDWDEIMYHAPYYLMVTAAGNSQKSKDNGAPIFGTPDMGYDLLLGFATSKNGITVAAANVETTDQGELISAAVTAYSSYGPLDDGRIKPDIAAQGTNIYTTGSENARQYERVEGTSVAAPGVTGSMLLLQQYYEELEGRFMKAATLKGMVLHTADDVNAPGPDYRMGWGVINSKSAVELMTNNGYTSMISEEILLDGESKTYTVTANGITPLSVSISWTDPATGHVNTSQLNDITPALVNDLDIRITQGGETYFPWKLNGSNAGAVALRGDNKVDPYEKTELKNASGTYTITVSHKNKLDGGFQDFSLLVSGISLTDCVLSIPEDIGLGMPTESSVTLDWSVGTEALSQVEYKKKDATDWIVETTFDHSLTLGNLVRGTDYVVRLKTYCTENAGSGYTPEYEFSFLGDSTELIQFSDYVPLQYKLSFSVFPNPVQELINLEGNIPLHANYHIVSLNGITVRKGRAKEKQIYIGDLGAGLYVLSVQDDENIRTAKFYKS